MLQIILVEEGNVVGSLKLFFLQLILKVTELQLAFAL